MLVVEAIYRRLVSHRDPLPALVDDHVSIRRDNVVDLPLPDQALEHRDVQPSRRDALASPNLPNCLRIHAEEHRQLGDPLIE